MDGWERMAAESDKPHTVFAYIHAPNEAWLARAEREPVLEPELPIVDAHLHLWQPPNGYRYYVEEYARDLASCGHKVEASIYLQCFHMYRAAGPDHLRPVGETEFAVAQAALAASGPLTASRVAAGIVGYADLTRGRHAQELLEAHVEAGQGRFRGIRQLAKWDPNPVVRGQYSAPRPKLYLDPAFGRGLDVLTALGLSLDASVFHPQIPDVVQLARSHPGANIVLIHSGSPVGHGPYAGREAENHATWLAGMKALATCPNVTVKMGGILINLANFDPAQEDAPPSSRRLADLWRPYIEPCVELFGADRCMVSSNFPVDKAGFGYATVWNMFKRITAGCSDYERGMIFSGTARRVYRLD